MNNKKKNLERKQITRTYDTRIFIQIQLLLIITRYITGKNDLCVIGHMYLFCIILQ